MQTIITILRYEKARLAITWLCSAFGFEEVFSVPIEGNIVRHARLKLGDNIIMLGSVREEEPKFKSPLKENAITQALCVYIDDFDAHYERACLAGAEILIAPKNTDFESREYFVNDVEGHLWIFTTPANLP